LKIIIVESPSKSKTIESYMGSDYKVIASNGHIRDLSTKGKGGLGIDIPAGFIPRYEIIKDKHAKVSELKKVCSGNTIYLATDPDREGEAISWHLASVLGLDLNTVNRVEFNEITERAVTEAFSHPRHIDLSLVQSQETRRMLDRIIGFQLSSLLQNKIKTKSAGRVQSSVLKLIVDLEKEINDFVSTPYYEIEASYNYYKLDLVDDKLNKLKIYDYDNAKAYLDFLTRDFTLSDIITKKVRQESKPALITSTLQQEANIKYGFSPDRTMRAAQSLYEGKEIGNIHVGLITYMRTDSTRLSDIFIKDAQAYIVKNYGKDYLGTVKKGKDNGNIQDAHEAIRPTSLDRTPFEMDKYLSPDERKIYRLIYNRAISSLMAAAIFEEGTMVFDAKGYPFTLKGKKLEFLGYLKSLGVSEDDQDKLLPKLNKGDVITVDSIDLLSLETKPKSRYTEASIIKAMETLGIGRPSTYAQTIQKLRQSKYIEINEKKIYPTQEGMLSISKLEEFFSQIIEPKYTADMETMLDKIATNDANNVVELQKFYDGFYPIYEKAKKEMEKAPLVETGEMCPLCGAPLVNRVSKYGTFVSCSNFPECNYKPVKEEAPDQSLGITCPNCLKGNIIQKVSKGKIFYACNCYPKCKTIFSFKPVDSFCPTCGSVMLETPDGLKCSNKECGKPKEIKEGIHCPHCKTGILVLRTSSKGKNKGSSFWACNNFPKCKTAFFDEPAGIDCPVCGSLMVKKGDRISCSNKECDKFIK